MTMHTAPEGVKKLVYGLLAAALVLSLGLLFTVVNLSQAARLRSQTPLLPGFTYQGELFKGVTPVNATCEMAFRLYDGTVAGDQIGDAITTTVTVAEGLFSAHLNSGGEFGVDAFDGHRRWLDIAVQCPGDVGFTAFAERQELTPAPYAAYAVRAGSVAWDDITGIPPDLADGVAVRQLVQDFVLAAGENVAAGDVVSFFGGQAYGPAPAESVFNPAGTHYIAIAALSESAFVIAYYDGGNSGYGTAIIGTVSYGDPSWGSASVFNPATTSYIAIAALSESEFVIAYRDAGNSGYGTVRTGTVSGGSLAWVNASVFNAASTSNIAIAALSEREFVIAYSDVGNSGYGTAIVRSLAFNIGTAGHAASGGETVTVIIDGVSDVHSGLIPGRMYYLQSDGSLGTLLTHDRIGLAISETELLLDKLW